jgi:hypothetical protein
MLPRLTIDLPYANQPDALRHQLDTMSGYHRDIRDRLSVVVVVVDDGSQEQHPAHHIICDRDAAYRDKLHIRLRDDVVPAPSHEIQTDFVVRADIDEVCTERAVATILMNMYQAIAGMLLEQCHEHLESADVLRIPKKEYTFGL